MVKINDFTALVRLRREYMRLKSDPVPFICAEPLPSNILEWHYVVRGPEKSPYHGGLYHGLLRFPVGYPFKPPSIYMLTPSGRFRPNTRLCLSISDFHPDTWNPSWSVSTILTGLLSFMLESTPTVGSLETSDFQKRSLARRSHQFNLTDPVFCDLFPDLVQETKIRLSEMQSVEAQGGGDGSAGLMAAAAATAGSSTVLGNLVMLLAVVAFAVVVHCVLASAT